MKEGNKSRLFRCFPCGEVSKSLEKFFVEKFSIFFVEKSSRQGMFSLWRSESQIQLLVFQSVERWLERSFLVERWLNLPYCMAT